jgi:anti-sigma factor RsiW
MNSTTHQPLSDEEIHALLDGQISSSVLAELEIRLSHDPAAQATLLKWQQQRLALKLLYQGVMDEPVPSSLTNTVIPVQRPREKASWVRWGGSQRVFCCLLLSGGFLTTSC